MRAIVVALLLWLLPLVAMAQTSSAFDTAMDGLDRIMSQGGDDQQIYRHLSDTIRTSRALGQADPDFAIFYAMLADHIRNVELNPVYALQVAEEGLALIGGDQAQADFSTILQVTRSYALADLGRLDEAFAQAQLILPAYAQIFDQALADDFAADAQNWGRGELSQFNTAATELARTVLERAYELLDIQAYGQVLAVASTALLPLGTGLPEGDVRGINTEAEMLTARALSDLGRHRDAGNAWLRALGYMTTEAWDMTGSPAWWGDAPMSQVQGDVAFTILQGLATSAGIIGIDQLERAALAEAAGLARTPRDRYSVLLRRARLALTAEDASESIALLQQSRDTAQDAGYMLDARVAEFYLAMVIAQQGERRDGRVETASVVAATDTAVAEYDKAGVAGRDFILSTAARLLLRSADVDIALAYAREAMQIQQAQLAARRDTGYGQQQARRNARAVVELFLNAAHTGAALGQDPALASADCPDARAFMGCLVTASPDRRP